MAEPVLLLKASAAAAVLAALAVLLTGWPWRQPRPGWTAAGGALGLGAGFLAGAWALGQVPHFPPREDQDRLLLVLLPAVGGAEVAAAFLGRRAWLAWSLRLFVAAGAARTLLHGSIYVTDSGVPGTREWSPAQTWLILAGLAAALAANWALLGRLANRRAGRTALCVLALTTAGAGVTIMLSGYTSAGQLGFPLAAGLVGTAAASLALAGTVDLRGPAGVGVVGLFALLVVGRFFGELSTANAALLFAAPLLGWLPELLPARRVGPRVRGVVRVALAAVPVAIVLALAVQRFQADSAQPSSTPGASEPSVDDYLNFGK
jgi:hypothetical protein